MNRTGSSAPTVPGLWLNVPKATPEEIEALARAQAVMVGVEPPGVALVALW